MMRLDDSDEETDTTSQRDGGALDQQADVQRVARRRSHRRKHKKKAKDKETPKDTAKDAEKPKDKEQAKDNPPDEKALFGDGDEWADARKVEAETAAKTTPTPDEAHNHWTGWAWSKIPGVVRWGYNKYYGTQPENDEAMVTQIARNQLVAYLEGMLHTSVRLEGLKIDLAAGLVRASSLVLGPMLHDLGGRQLLIGGATANELEVQFSIGDLFTLRSGGKMSDAITIRFTSMILPRLHLGNAEPVKPVATADGQPRNPSQATPTTTPTGTKPPTATKPTTSQPPAKPPMPALIMNVLDALRAGFHVGAIDVDIHEQDGEEVTFGVTMQNGAIRGQLAQTFSGASAAMSAKTPSIEIGDKHHTVASLRASIVEYGEEESGIFEGPETCVRKLAGTHLAPMRAALTDDTLTPDERTELLALIAYIEGDATALDGAALAIAERAKRDGAVRRVEAERRAKALGPRPDVATGHVCLENVHGAIVGKQYSATQQTSARVHADGIAVRDLDAHATGIDAHVGGARMGPLDLRLLGDQVGVELGGVTAKNVDGHQGADTVGGFESLELGKTRAAARLGNLKDADPQIDAHAHVGPLTATGLGGMQGDRAAIIDHLYVGPTDVDAHKHGDSQRLDAHGLSANVRGVHGALDPTTAVSVDSLRLAPSSVHADRTTPSKSDGSTPKPVIGGSVTTGALAIDGVDVQQPQLGTHAHVEHVGVGQAAASLKDTQAAALIKDVNVTDARGTYGAQDGKVASLGLDKVSAVGDTSTRQGDVDVGTLSMAALQAHSGKGKDAIDAEIGQLTVKPTTGHVEQGRAKVVNDGIVVTGAEASKGTSAASIARLETGKLDADYVTERPLPVAVELAKLEVAKAQVTQTEGATTSQTTIDRASLTAPGVHLGSDGTVDGGVQGVHVSGAQHTTSSGERGAKGTGQAWQLHDQHLHVDRVRVGGMGITGDDNHDGHHLLALEELAIQGLDHTSNFEGDRHTHVMQRAKLLRDQAIAAAEALRKVEIREATEVAEAALAAKKKKPEKIEGKLGKAVVKANDKFAKAETAANHAYAKVKAAQSKSAGKEESRDQDARVKDRGLHTHVGSLELAKVEANVSGLDEGAPHVEAVELDKVTGHDISYAKQLGDLERMTVDVEDITLDLDAAHHGRVVVRLRMGDYMLENLIGKKLGAVANKLAGLDGNGVTLTIGIKDGLLDFGTMATAFDKNWARSKVIEGLLSTIHVGGDKPKKKLGGEHEQPHLRVPWLGDLEVEQLGLAGLHTANKKVIVSRKLHGPRGGVHIKNLLETGIQAAIDGARGDDPQPPAKDALGMANLDTALIGELDVRGIDLRKQTGTRPDHGTIDDTRARVDQADLGPTAAVLEDIPQAKNLVATIAGLVSGAKATPKPSTPSSEIAPDKATVQPATKPPANPLDSLFAILDAVLGGATPSTSKGTSSKPSTRRRTQHLTDATGHEQLDVYNTGGGGDCGIHAMFGQPQGGSVRAVNPDAQRDQLGAALDNTDVAGHALIDNVAFTNLMVDLVLQILSGAPMTVDRDREARAFLAVRGFWNAVTDAKQQDDVDYTAHGLDRTRYIDNLIVTYVRAPMCPIGDALRAHLIDNFMHSNSANDAALRGRLESAGDAHTRDQILLQAPLVDLRRAIEADLDVVVTIVDSAGAPPLVGQRHHQLAQAHAALGGHVRVAVTANLAQLLPAYANVVRTPGYYLHAEDLQLLARLNGLDLHIYREHDQHPGQLVEQLHQAGAGNRVDVFHSGAHYEQARHE